MASELSVLLVTAASIGFFHTVLGPDHYLPFIMMASARKWSKFKTLMITLLCGLGHIGSSILLGGVGVALGIAVRKLEIVESHRGDLAAWALIAFGLVYFVWGVRRAYKNRRHVHRHYHENGQLPAHADRHYQDQAAGIQAHGHANKGKANITPWALFVIFVLGPCEPLIPILMYPAAQSSMSGLVLVTAVFGTVTIATMAGIVMASVWGISFVRLGRLERYTHAVAGATICLCGLAIRFLGL